MKKNNNHINFEKDFFGKNDISYSKKKEDVWLQMEAKLNKKSSPKVIKTNFSKYLKLSIAAVFILTVGLSIFLRFYSENIYCPNGQHRMVSLPDGSKVTLNANSQLAYNPYWWRFSRDVNFKGEAFFEVKKGSKFQVISEKGTTTVLGTKFNIFSRKGEYKVHCISGKVMVSNNQKESVILTKNNYIVLDKKEIISKFNNENNSVNSISWIENEFVFTSVPLNEIFEEIERQFDITIEGKENLKGISTSSFKRGSSPQELINIIGKPFGVVTTKVSDSKYIVSQQK